MSNKKLTILGVVAAVMMVLAVVTSQIGTNRPSQSYKNVNLVQGFDTSKIATVILKSEGEETKITLGTDGQYVVTNKDNYPALINEINGLVSEILDIKTVDLITSDSKNHSDLGVSEDNARFVVKFLDKSAKPIEGFNGIIISESDPEKQGVYVRLLGSDEVYLIAGTPWPKMSSMDYIYKGLTQVAKDDIESVSVTGPDGIYVIKRGESGDVILENDVPEGKKVKDSDRDSVFGALTSLQFTDVQKADKAQGLVFDTTYVCKLKDSTIYTIKIAKKDDKTFIIADAVFTDETPVTVKSDGSETEEELKAKEAILLAKDNARDFSQNHAGWVYEIASNKAGEVAKKLEDLFEDIEEEKDADAVDTPPGLNLP